MVCFPRGVLVQGLEIDGPPERPDGSSLGAERRNILTECYRWSCVCEWVASGERVWCYVCNLDWCCQDGSSLGSTLSR